MTDTYLQSLGFTATDETRNATRPTFSHAWRYQHECPAQDGTRLFIEHPLGIDSCRLSTLAAPLDAQDVFATVALDDKTGLESAISTFYTAHGGKGPVAARFEPNTYRPYRRGR